MPTLLEKKLPSSSLLNPSVMSTIRALNSDIVSLSLYCGSLVVTTEFVRKSGSRRCRLDDG